jgi:hypothetical protein
MSTATKISKFRPSGWVCIYEEVYEFQTPEKRARK